MTCGPSVRLMLTTSVSLTGPRAVAIVMLASAACVGPIALVELDDDRHVVFLTGLAQLTGFFTFDRVAQGLCHFGGAEAAIRGALTIDRD